MRRIADRREPGYPCRISLTDSRPGDELLLVNYEHHPVASPYRMRFAIFVRRGEETFDAIDRVPEQLRLRTLAVRAFDANGMMAGWELVEGREIEGAIGHWDRALEAIGFYDTGHRDRSLRAWRAIVARRPLTEKEAAILRGVANRIMVALRLRRRETENGKRET